jgi:uncharacterized membrane protein
MVVLASLFTSEPVLVDGQAYLGVVLRTAPVPVVGRLLSVSQRWVRPAATGIAAVTRICMSMGNTSG